MDDLKRADLSLLAIVILNWNLPIETIQCIQSVQSSQGIENFKIILVDNGSTDDSIKLLKEHFGDTIQILQNGTNLGFAGGVNVGIRKALADGAGSVLLLNNDTVIAPDMIQILLAAAAKNMKAGIIGPVIYFDDASGHIWHIADRELFHLPVPIHLTERSMRRARAQPIQVDYITACGMLILRSVFERVGIFDPRFFMYFEDADFCRRARRHGFEILCVPEAKMWHKVSRSAHRQKPAARYLESWGRIQFFMRTATLGLRPLMLAYLLVRASITSLRDLYHQEPDLIKPAWLGLYDGFRNEPARFAAVFTDHKIQEARR